MSNRIVSGWCSWLSHLSNTQEVSSSSLGRDIFFSNFYCLSSFSISAEFLLNALENEAVSALALCHYISMGMANWGFTSKTSFSAMSRHQPCNRGRPNSVWSVETGLFPTLWFKRRFQLEKLDGFPEKNPWTYRVALAGCDWADTDRWLVEIDYNGLILTGDWSKMTTTD